MRIRKDSETGKMIVAAAPADSRQRKVIVVSNHADHMLTSQYELAVTPIHRR